MCVSASGLSALRLLIVLRKHINEHWFDPIEEDFHAPINRICARYMVAGRLPSTTAVMKVADKGSIEMPILRAAVKHVSSFIRSSEVEHAVLLTLDGYSSRNGTGWVDECKDENIEAVIVPANTSLILQPCDQAVNKNFKQSMRESVMLFAK